MDEFYCDGLKENQKGGMNKQKTRLLHIVGPYRGPGWSGGSDDDTSKLSEPSESYAKTAIPVIRSRLTSGPPQWDNPFELGEFDHFGRSKTLPSKRSDLFLRDSLAPTEIALPKSLKRTSLDVGKDQKAGTFTQELEDTLADDFKTKLCLDYHRLSKIAQKVAENAAPSPTKEKIKGIVIEPLLQDTARLPNRKNSRSLTKEKTRVPAGELLRFLVRRQEKKKILDAEKFLNQVNAIARSTGTAIQIFRWLMAGDSDGDAEFGIYGCEYDRIDGMKRLIELASTKKWPSIPEGLKFITTGESSQPAEYVTTSPHPMKTWVHGQESEYTVLEFTWKDLSDKRCWAVETRIPIFNPIPKASFQFSRSDRDGGTRRYQLFVVVSLTGKSASLKAQKQLCDFISREGGLELNNPKPELAALASNPCEALTQHVVKSMEKIQPKSDEKISNHQHDEHYDDTDCSVSDGTDSQISFSSESEGEDSSECVRDPANNSIIMNFNSNEGMRSHGHNGSREGQGQQSQNVSNGSRSNRLSSGSGGYGGGEDDFSDGSGERRKRQRREDTQPVQDLDSGRRFACPYYRFDPTNREHLRCKDKSFPTLARVKGHVLRSHLKPLQCQRCCGFRAGDQGQISHHLQVKNCQKAEFIPLDPEVERKGKELSRSGRRNNWAQVCMVLFDCDASEVPDPFFEDGILIPASTILPPPPLTALSSEESLDSLLSDPNFHTLVQQRLTGILGDLLPRLMAEQMPSLISAYRESQPALRPARPRIRQPSTQHQHSASPSPHSSVSSGIHSSYTELIDQPNFRTPYDELASPSPQSSHAAIPQYNSMYHFGGGGGSSGSPLPQPRSTHFLDPMSSFEDIYDVAATMAAVDQGLYASANTTVGGTGSVHEPADFSQVSYGPTDASVIAFAGIKGEPGMEIFGHQDGFMNLGLRSTPTLSNDTMYECVRPNSR